MNRSVCYLVYVDVSKKLFYIIWQKYTTADGLKVVCNDCTYHFNRKLILNISVRIL